MSLVMDKMKGEVEEVNFTNYYNRLKEDPNNISFWYPKIKDCGIPTPETFIMSVPEEVLKACLMEGDRNACIDTVYSWVRDELMPALPMNLRGLLFIKNGAYSNKFEFRTACAHYNALEIANSIIEINCASLMFGTGGNAEIAIRDRIEYVERITPCIYGGMPLRNEYRVFYDFDKKKALYIVNYWDWDYCHENIAQNATDKLVYEAVYPKFKKRYDETCKSVKEYVAEHMQNVTGLQGIWSVDIMEANGELWLIDMAEGYRSAYWNPKLIKE